MGDKNTDLKFGGKWGLEMYIYMRIISVSVAVEDIRMDDTIWGVNRKM